MFNMSHIKSFSEFVESLNEAKTTEDKIKSIARHLAHDKDVIKYLNTTRSKREIGWRDLLDKKVHGADKDYINYITKNMVANLNPKITGPVAVKVDDGDFDNPEIEIDSRLKGLSTDDKIEDVNRRLEDVEDMFGIDPDDSETLIKAREKAKELGFDQLPLDGDDIEEDEKEEE